MDETKGAVHLMTAHVAKGLEWPNVAVLGLAEGMMPLARQDIEEERRLFYVAMTRARDTLTLCVPAERERWGGKREVLKPSRFIAEMEEKCQE